MSGKAHNHFQSGVYRDLNPNMFSGFSLTIISGEFRSSGPGRQEVESSLLVVTGHWGNSVGSAETLSDRWLFLSDL